jgi:hypothetical protein
LLILVDRFACSAQIAYWIVHPKATERGKYICAGFGITQAGTGITGSRVEQVLTPDAEYLYAIFFVAKAYFVATIKSSISLAILRISASTAA